MSEAVSEMDNLPKRWITSSVGQLHKIVGGGTPSTRVEKYWNGDIPWISSADIHGLYDIRPRRKIAPEAIKNSATNLVPAGSIIVVTRVGLGKIARINTPLCFSQDSQALIENVSFVNPDYMLYYLSQAVQSFKHASRGTTISGVTKKQLSDLLVPVAPLNEQKRIVSKIESIFAQIDAKQQELERLASQIKSVPDSVAELKGSILKKAFEGKLVPQDPDDEPVEAILKRIRRASEKELIFEKYDSPSGWIRVLLSDIAQINPPKPEKNSISDRLEVSFVPMRNVEALNGKIDLSETREYVKVRTGYTYFQNDDIIFAKITPCMENGKIAIVTGLKNGIGFGSTEFHVIRLKNEMLRKFYFLYFIQSDFRYSAQHKMKGTAGQLRVPSDYMKNILVPLPPLNEQKRIVAKIESIFAQIDTKQQELEKLASQIRSVPDSFAELKGSILKKAFEGRLVPQDSHDEPASVLLERIK